MRRSRATRSSEGGQTVTYEQQQGRASGKTWSPAGALPRINQPRPQPVSAKAAVDRPRIGNGAGLFVVGIIFLALGVFGVLAGAGGSTGAMAFGTGAFALGAGIIAVGFWVNLFSKVEARLIDIQNAILATRQLPSSQTAVPSPLEEKPPASEAEMMKAYGITFDGEKYSFGEFKYDKLSDALNYARRTRGELGRGVASGG